MSDSGPQGLERICAVSEVQDGIHLFGSGLASQEGVLASIDIKDIYLHVYREGHQRFLRFAIGKVHFQFVAFPFGLAFAPQVFKKVFVPVLALLSQHRISMLGPPCDLAYRFWA